MRLWSLHPCFLDPRGLTALWREALLAAVVLAGQTRGYRAHPQLTRFRQHPAPRAAITAYLSGIHAEATRRGYRFRAPPPPGPEPIPPILVSTGQVRYELALLLRKLAERSPAWAEPLRRCPSLRVHPLFQVVAGPIAPWERVQEEILRLSLLLPHDLPRDDEPHGRRGGRRPVPILR
jgi:hypothetical protein